MGPIIKIENLSKQYRLGNVGTGTLSHDLNRWWAKLRGKEDPFLKIGETNNQNTKGESDYVWALKDINLEVMPGEVLGIIGKNGAGKSTLLKLLSRVTAPTTGSIRAHGRIASLLEVGTGFHPELTGRENIYLNGAILGMTKAEIHSKFDEIVDFAGVERYIDTPVKRYSSGMYVRLAFAVAAHLEPEILVVDEVLAVGDAEFQKKAIGKMQDVSLNDGRTVLFVSHNLPVIAALCRTALLLTNGSISVLGSTDIVLTEYRNKSFKRELGLIKEKDRDLEFLGISNLSELINLDISKNLIFIFQFYSKKRFKSVFIDLALYDSQERMIIHTKSKFISDGIDFEPNKKNIISYNIHYPQLAPGDYYLTIYIYNSDKVLYWCDNIRACSVNSLNPFSNNKTLILDEIKGIIVPQFSITNQTI